MYGDPAGRQLRRIALCGVVSLALHCGGASSELRGEAAFGQAVEASVDASWLDAAQGMYAFLSGAGPDDERYDRALIVLAKALEAEKLSYPASLYYLDVAKGRRNPELIADAVEGLRRIVTNYGHDAELIVDGYLATADLDGMREESAPFATYLHAMNTLRQGRRRWALAAFERLQNTDYEARATLVLGLDALGRGDSEQGLPLLEGVLEASKASEALKREAELALARYAMESQAYGEAFERYERVRETAPERPELLLEMGWAAFYMGDSRRALGLLMALDAPVFSGLIAPERFLLEAFALRRLCQFEPARSAAVRLRARYGETLDALQAGKMPRELKSLRRATLRRPRLRSESRWISRMRGEKARIDALSEGRYGLLRKRLLPVYDHALVQVQSATDARVSDEAGVLARELLDADEGVKLILHELSVQLLRGRIRPAGAPEKSYEAIKAGDDDVAFRFRGEFWTDEIDELVVTLPDRCLRS